MLKTLCACIEQHRLILAEKVLLEQTLRGSIKALIDILSLANPAAFGRATRLRHSVEQLLTHFEIRERWPVEVAAMLSQIGCVTLPPATVEKTLQLASLETCRTGNGRPHAGLRRQVPCEYSAHRTGPRDSASLSAPIYKGSTQNSAAGPASELPWGARAFAWPSISTRSSPKRIAPSIHWLSCVAAPDSYDAVILDAFAKLRGESQDRAHARIAN